MRDGSLAPKSAPLTPAELDQIEARAGQHKSLLLDRSSSEGGPVSWRNPLANDVHRLVAEVRRLRAFVLAVRHAHDDNPFPEDMEEALSKALQDFEDGP